MRIIVFSLKSLKDNWSCDYQDSINFEVPNPNGGVNWNFKCPCYNNSKS